MAHAGFKTHQILKFLMSPIPLFGPLMTGGKQISAVNPHPSWQGIITGKYTVSREIKVLAVVCQSLLRQTDKIHLIIVYTMLETVHGQLPI
jgi:hypothetical protein